MSEYKISIIIPTFNIEHDLKRAIDSLLNQTIGFENLEIILVDDNSTDKTQEIILDYSIKYKNIKYYFLKQNSGSAGKPRNKAIELATSDYIMFLDNDDEYVKEACEIFYNKITETNVNFIVGTKVNELFTPNDYPKEINESPDFVERNILENLDYLYSPFTYYSGAMWCKIFKRGFLVENNIKCLENLPEDVYFMHQCYYLNTNILFLTNLPLYNHYFYRINGKSISSTVSASYLLKGFLMFDELENLSKKYDNSFEFFNRYTTMFLQSYSYYIIAAKASKKVRLDLIKKYSTIANKYDIHIKSNLLIKIWHKLSCSKHFKLALIYTNLLNILISLKNLILRRKITL